MTEFLCLGGPLHGQTLDVPVPENGITLRPPERAFLLRKEGDPVPQPLHYAARTLNAETEDGKKLARTVMVVEQVSPPEVMALLANVLITEWIREGEQIDEASGADSESGVRRAEGRGGDAAAGNASPAPRSPLL